MDDIAVVGRNPRIEPEGFRQVDDFNADHRVWQDVYKPSVGERTLYVKFTLDAQQAPLLISFKEA